MLRLISFLLAAASCFAQQPSTPSEETRILFEQVDPILQTLSEITGWKIKHKVPADIITKDQLHDFVEKRMKQEVKPEDLRIESLTLRMFGLVPESFDLEKATIDLVTEQAAAFYDYNKKRLFIIESSSTFIEQRVVLVHELAHALADQQFSLAKYIKKGNQSDDDATAREAVMEGQATWLMWAYTSKTAGGDPRPSEIVLDTMRGSNSSTGGAQYPVFENSPLYMRESLVFPYTEGALFQEAVFEKYGKDGFSEVFRRAPRTTAQIMHPKMYFENAKTADVKLPELPNAKKFRTLVAGSMGEFDHRILAEQFASRDQAVKLAPHWRGGVFQLYEERTKEKHPVLAWASAWDTEESAKAWFAVYRKVLEGKSKQLTWTTQSQNEISGRNERGVFHVRQDENRVSAVEGIPATLN